MSLRSFLPNKEALERIKLGVEIVLAAISAIATIAAFSPKIREILRWLNAVSDPYLAPLAPYAWLMKWFLLVAAIYFVITVYNHWKHRRSFITTLDDRFTLDIHDSAGQTATLRQMTWLRADIDGVQSYRHRIWATGGHKAPLITTKDYHSEVREAKADGGATVYDLMFIPPLTKRTRVWQRFECELSNSFGDNAEFIDHEILYPENKLTLEIFFPPTRAPTEVTMQRKLGNFAVQEGKLPVEIRDGRPTVQWVVRSPKLGQVYRIAWKW